MSTPGSICRYTQTHTPTCILAHNCMNTNHRHTRTQSKHPVRSTVKISPHWKGTARWFPGNVKTKDSDACRKGERWTLILKIASCVTAVLFFHYKLCGIISEMCCEDLCEVGRIKHPQLFIIKMPQNSRNILVLAHVLILCHGNFKYSSRKIRLCR